MVLAKKIIQKSLVQKINMEKRNPSLKIKKKFHFFPFPFFFSRIIFQKYASAGYMLDFIEQTDLVIAKNCKIMLEITQTMSYTLRKVQIVYKCCKIYCTERSKSKKIYY